MNETRLSEARHGEPVRSVRAVARRRVGEVIMKRIGSGSAIAVAVMGLVLTMGGQATAVPDDGRPDRGQIGSRDGVGAPPKSRMEVVAQLPNATGATNSDLAFWGDLAVAGNYHGFRIFDISGPTPQLITDFRCFGPQGDPSLYDRDGDGDADLLFLSVDRTLSGPQCGAVAVAHDAPNGWEGIRVFDISNLMVPVQIAAVYQDCGSHTHTLFPDPERNRVLLYNSSYPLRPGPTCGAVRGPAAGRDALHGVIQVVAVPLDNPAAAAELTELPVSYPGDADNKFDPDEHALPGFGDLRACHDIGVFVELRLAAAACAEQAQLWRIGPTGLPDTTNPIWIYDDNVDEDGPGGGDVAVDFWHSATFTWDGKIVNFSDESFGDGCPSTTPGVGDTGRTHFLDVATGEHLSAFQMPRPEAGAYCSTHQGNVVATKGGRYLLAQAWYMGGVDIIDFTNPSNPKEIAYYDAPPAGAEGSDNWAHYWYEQNPRPGTAITTWGQDGVHNPATGKGFQKFLSGVGLGARIGLDHLNPQTQERVLR